VQGQQQAQESLGTSDVVIITERVDDVALLIGQMVKRGCVEVLDRPLPRHGKQRGRSGGWTAVRGRASILTEGDHRQGSVEAASKGMHHTLGPRSGQESEPLAWRDDRWAQLLKHVSTPTYWHRIERDVHARSLAVDDWSQDVIRGDATTVSGEHAIPAPGLRQCGHRKDEPRRPQRTGMRGSLAPLGRP